MPQLVNKTKFCSSKKMKREAFVTLKSLLINKMRKVSFSPRGNFFFSSAFYKTLLSVSKCRYRPGIYFYLLSSLYQRGFLNNIRRRRYERTSLISPKKDVFSRMDKMKANREFGGGIERKERCFEGQ